MVLSVLLQLLKRANSASEYQVLFRMFTDLHLYYDENDLYELDTVELPVTKESLNIVKNRIQSPIKKLSVNPKIPLILNSNVTREQIKDAQQKVLRLSRNI